MPGSNADTAILVFARAPVAGATKTRLIPLLGAEGAAALHRRLLLHALATAAAARPGRMDLWCSPDDSHPFLQAAASRHGARLLVQQGADLGERMAHAFAQALQQSRCVIIIGTDCPVLTAAQLQAAADALRGGQDAVFAPAEDGGYALAGLAREAPQLFAGIAWGGSDVMSATRTRLRDGALRWQELATLWDVDRPDDYHRLLQSGLLDALPDAT
jgi:rSAM/selenodomain-associated transferase 1